MYDIKDIKTTFRAVELLVYIKDFKNKPKLYNEIQAIGREYYFIRKEIGDSFIYYHINTLQSSGAFRRIIELGLKLKKCIETNSSYKDFLIYSFSRVLKKNQPVSIDYYKGRIAKLYKTKVLHSLFFVDNYIQQSLEDEFQFKHITQKEYLLKIYNLDVVKIEDLIPTFIGREKDLEELESFYEKVHVSSRVGGWIDIASTSPNLIGIKSAPGVGKTTFVKSFLADMVYFYSGNYYAISTLKRNDQGDFHPFYVMLSELLEYDNLTRSSHDVNDIIEKKMQIFSQYVEPSEINSLREAFEFLYYYLETNDLLGDGGLQDKFSISIQNLFSAMIKKVFVQEQRPYIFVFEDIHLYKRGAYKVLEFLLKNFCLIKPALFILTYSNNYNAKDLIKYNLSEITLGVFDKLKTKKFANIFLPNINMSTDIINELYTKSCGHPYYIKEYLYKLSQNEDVISGKTSQVNFPINIQAIISGKINYIPDYLFYILQLAAIIGVEVPINDLKALIETTIKEPFDLEVAINELVKYDFIDFIGDTIAFKTQYYRIALYETISYDRIQELHLIYAQILDEEFKDNQEVDLMVIVDNYLKSKRPEKSLTFLIFKIEELLEERKANKAKDYINFGLKKLNTFPTRVKNYSKTMLFLTYTGLLSITKEKEKEKNLLSKISQNYLPIVSDKNVENYYKLRMAYYYYSIKEYDDAFDIAQELSINYERSGNNIRSVESLLLVGKSVYKIKGIKTSLSFLNKVPQNNPTQYQKILLEYNRGIVYLDNNYLAKAISHLTEAQGLIQEMRYRNQFLKIETLLAEAFFRLGDYDDALEIFIKSIAIAQNKQDFAILFYANLYCGRIFFYREDLENAKLYYNNAMGIANKNDLFFKEISLDYCELFLKIGNIQEANKYIDKVIDKIDKDSLDNFKVKGYILRATILFLQEKYSECIADLEASIDILKVMNVNSPKEVFYHSCGVLITHLTIKKIKTKYKPIDFFNKSLDFLKTKMSRITDHKNKVIFRNSYYIKKIIKNDTNLI